MKRCLAAVFFLAPLMGADTFTVTQASLPPQVALRYVPVAPCRIADTRTTPGPFGGPAIPGGATRTFSPSASSCQIPSSAQAFALNVGAVPQGVLGFLTVWPTGQAQPNTSALNSDGRIKSNAVIVPAGSGGTVSVFATNTTDVVIDIAGYFAAASTPSALSFFPMSPCRVADTRTAASPLNGPYLPAAATRTFPLLSSTCNIPATAQAYSLNFAAVPRSSALGFLTVWPTGQPQPLVATLNAVTGAVAANAGIVPAGTGGAINAFVSNDTDLVIDINGYFAPPASGGLSLYTLQPCRVLETRLPAGAPPFTGKIDVDVIASGCGALSTAKAYVFNSTVIPPAILGFLTLWPQGIPQPLVSTLNAVDAAVTSNLALVVTSNGLISAFSSNPTHMAIDLYGYFAP